MMFGQPISLLGRSGSRSALVVVGAVVVLLFEFLTAASASESCSSDSVGSEITGSELAECVRAGGVEFSSITVTGVVDLSRSSIEGPFVCRDCDFTDSVTLRDAGIDGRLDFSGSTFRTSQPDVPVFDAVGASFGRAAVFSTSDRISTASGEWQMTGASFGQAARFGRMVFGGPAGMGSVRFVGDADFRLAVFMAEAIFTDVRVGGDLDFEGAQFTGAISAQGARISRTFDAGANYKGDVRYSGVEVGGVFRLKGARFTACDQAEGDTCVQVVDLRELTVDEFLVDFDDLELISGPSIRDEISELAEANARKRGDLTLANEVHYDRLSRQSSNWLDRLFYGWVGGYFVRWAHPVIALVAVFAFGALRRVQAVRREQLVGGADETAGPGALVFFLGSDFDVNVGGAVRASNIVYVPGGGPAAPKPSAGGRANLLAFGASVAAAWRNVWPPLSTKQARSVFERIEALITWILLFVTLRALGNALPVVRELIDNFL